MWIATSKQRTSLRRAVASDKKKIAEYIMQYNAVLTDLNLIESPLSSEEVMEGKFPWSAISGIYSGTSLIQASIIQALYCLGTSIFQTVQSGCVACTIIKLVVDERSLKVLVYL